MSRLPRLHSSPTQAGPSMPTLKRKAAAEEDDDEARDQPRKLPAIGASRPARTLQPSRTTPNLTKATSSLTTSSGPKPVLPAKLTLPRAPNLTRSTRGTSAPPATRPPPPPAARSRTVSGRSATDDKRFTALQTQLTSIESARAADAARLAQDMEAERAKVAELQANHTALSRELVAARNHDLDQRRELVHAADEIETMRKKHAREVMDLEMDVKQRAREAREVGEDLRLCRGDLEREREAVGALKATLGMQSTAHLTLATQNQLLQAQVEAQTRAIAELAGKVEEAERAAEGMRQEVREGEIVRRKLHNMVQELKGNIRVFCRVRPVLPSDSDEQANMVFPDKREHKEIVLESSSESATGQERKEVYNFGFDKVFEPQATQADVFEEISQLAQSCTDGYNVCIFAYGQTGSGKSYTMEGGATEETAGMIPRAVEQVFRVAEEMKTKGWTYTMEGQFLEIYNETINDLLGAHDFDKKKHEIKHDARTTTTTMGGTTTTQTQTRVTDVTVVALHSAAQVRTLLAQAQKRRSVAATLVNERSSRSHSVFTLRIRGVCSNNSSGTGGTSGTSGSGGGGGGGGGSTTCEGSLNLVDLAGSERLNVSFANGADRERLKETQSINKSLSALGDVIAALGERGAASGGPGGGNGGPAEGKHIPYRNSKLTYLLQNSLSGNSKTLMFLNLSPLAAHLNESLTSLRFATKVNNTTIGTAKKQARTS